MSLRVENNHVLGIDLPPSEVISRFHYSLLYMGHGNNLCNDLRGTDRYIYGFSVYSYRVSPYVMQFDTYGGGVLTRAQIAGEPYYSSAIVADPSYLMGGVPYIWALQSGADGNLDFYMYNCSTNVATSKTTSGLKYTFFSEISLCHTCGAYGGSSGDDYIYLIGNEESNFYRYSISGNTWSSLTSAPSPSGPGCRLLYIPKWSEDRLLRIAGGDTVTIDYYSISDNSWTPVSYNPSVETFGRGTWATNRDISNSTKILIKVGNTDRVYDLDVSTGIMKPCATMTAADLEYRSKIDTPQSGVYPFLSGAYMPHGPVSGNHMVYIKTEDGFEFIYYMAEWLNQISRTLLVC